MHISACASRKFLSAGQPRSWLWLLSLLIPLLVLIYLLQPSPAYAAGRANYLAQANPVPGAVGVTETLCYAVADERNLGTDDPDNQFDTLVVLDPATGNAEIIGETNTENIEAISFGPDNEIFAANGWRLGTLDKSTGAFTPRPSGFGTANGSLGAIKLDDIDGIAYDLDQNILFGVHRRFDNGQGEPQPDVLFAINPATGQHIPGYFEATGDDYLVVPPVVDDEGEPMLDIDDIQFDPVNDVLYGVMNVGGQSGVLVTIDAESGIATSIGTFRDATTNEIIDDIEGISFANDGTLYVSTGDNYTGDLDDLNSLYRVDPTTALGTRVGPFPSGPKDYEAVACLSAEAAIVLKKYTNGPGQAPDDADTIPGPTIEVGDTVTWTYIFTNTGVLTLTDLSLIDDQIGSIGPSSSCVPAGTTLAPGTSLTCVVTGVAATGQYTNVGTITGTSVPTPLFPEITVSDTNPSHYFGATISPPEEPAAIGDYVWHDVNGDGLQGSDEPGLEGVTVTLLTDSCSTPTGLSAVTDEDGLYRFTDLAPGTYCVQFTLPSGYTFTTPNAGGEAEDSDANPTNGTSGPITLASGEINLTVDAGLVVDSTQEPAALGDTVWLDENLNGLQDGVGTESGEQGVPNVQVNLIPVEEVAAASGDASPAAVAVTATLTTDENGRYFFGDLPPGDYYVQFIGPAEYAFTIPDAEGDSRDAEDSDAQVPLLTMTLASNVDEVEPGQIITYTITYTNTHATLPANGVVVSTTVPADTSFIAAGSSDGWTCADVTPGSVCKLNLASVPAGASGSVDFAVRLQEAEDGVTIPPAIFLLVRLMQSRQANTPIVTLVAGEVNLTLDAGLVPIQNSGDVEAGLELPTNTGPTNLPPGEQPQQQESLFLPSLRHTD